jgi:hypothetical protein
MILCTHCGKDPEEEDEMAKKVTNLTTASPLNSSEIEGLRQILEERFRNDRDVQIDALARDLFRLTTGEVGRTSREGAVRLYQAGWRKGYPA